MSFTPTHYQQAAVQDTVDWLCNNSGNPLTVLPVGTGKSIILNNLTKFFIDDYSQARILHLTHVKELISQNYAALRKMWPDAPAGCYSASLGSRDLFSQIVFGGIQSIHNKAKMLGHVDICICDESHLIGFKSDTMYRRLIDDMLSINPHMRLIGLTATPFRLQGGDLRYGNNALFTDIAYEYKIKQALEDGYMTPLFPKPGDFTMNIDGVGKRGGEYISSQLQEACDLDGNNRAAVAEIIDIGRSENRKAWLVFCTGVKHAEHVCAEFIRCGITCAIVHGGTKDKERDRILKEFASGGIKCVVNVDCLTTGYDNKNIDLLAFLRPTGSPGLWIQALGRGTRLIDPSVFGLPDAESRIAAILSSTKPNCRVLDYGNNTVRLGTLDCIVPPPTPGEKKRPGEAPIKECINCKALCYAGARKCHECGYEFPATGPSINATASTAAILSTQIKAEWLSVDDVSYRFAMEKNKKVMEVVYKCGLMVYKDKVRLEHSGGARNHAVSWWHRHEPGARVPESIKEGLARAGNLPKPSEICVKPNGKYLNVIGRRF